MKIRGGDGKEDSGSNDTGDEYEVVRQSTPKHAGQTETALDDDTVPEEDYVGMSTAETGDTIESSAFIDLNKEEREQFQVGEWEALEEGRLDLDLDSEGGEAASTPMDRQFQNLSTTGLGETETQAMTSEEGELVTSNPRGEGSQESALDMDLEVGGAGSRGMEFQFQNLSTTGLGETETQATTSEKRELVTTDQGGEALLAPARYPKRAVAQQKACMDMNMEEQSEKDVYDFDEDSFDDETFIPQRKNLGKLYSPSKPVVEIKSPKKVGAASKASIRTPPEVVKARRDPELEERWRKAGGHTPDQSEKKTTGYGTFNKDLLNLLVHKQAKSRKIDLRQEPLKPGFFRDLVRLYGNVPKSNSSKLAPYTSHQYIQRKWRELFCTKKVSTNGSLQADVHKYDWPQERAIPCQLCSDEPQEQDTRDQLLQTLVDQLNKQEEVPTSKEIKVGKETCPDCHSQVTNLKRHRQENCRSNPKNLSECSLCSMMVIKRSLREHQEGRLNKKTGAWIVQPCKGNDPEKKAKQYKCPTCGRLVKDLKRHIKERHDSKEVKPELKRPAESPQPQTSQEAKKQKQCDKKPTEAQKPKRTIQLSTAFITKTLEDVITKHQLQKSMEDDSGIDQKQMIEEGIAFTEESIGITVSKAPFIVEKDGNCLFTSEAFAANPSLTKEENAAMGTDLRQTLIGEAIDYVKNMSDESLLPIQIALTEGQRGEYMSREQVVGLFERFRTNGQWGGGLGDLMPQVVSSFTRTPLFVIWINTDQNQTTGVFVNPGDVFNMPEYVSVPRVVVRHNNHYEPLLVREADKEALQAMYRNAQQQQLAMGAIQLPLLCRAGWGERGGRRDRTPDDSKRKQGNSGVATLTSGEVASGQRAQQESGRGSCAGNCFASKMP